MSDEQREPVSSSLIPHHSSLIPHHSSLITRYSSLRLRRSAVVIAAAALCVVQVVKLAQLGGPYFARPVTVLDGIVPWNHQGRRLLTLAPKVAAVLMLATSLLHVRWSTMLLTAMVLPAAIAGITFAIRPSSALRAPSPRKRGEGEPVVLPLAPREQEKEELPELPVAPPERGE